MPKVEQRKNERFESLMRRFKRGIDKDRTLQTLRKYEYYEKPSTKRKRRKNAAKKRWERTMQESEQPKPKY